MEDRIFYFYDRSQKDSIKLRVVEYNDSIQSLFAAALKEPETYAYPFSSLTKIGRVSSPDQKFRIFNWNYYDAGGICHYCMILQSAPDASGKCRVTVFRQTTVLSINYSETLKFNYKEWYGALYYSIVPQINNGRTYYALLGFIPHNDLSNRKVLDMMYFDENVNPVLGLPVISMIGKTYCRLLFEYNERITMMMHYDDNAKMFVFDHLAPAASQYTGNYAFYGPDGTYDGLAFDGKQWHVIPKINLKNKKYKHTRDIIRYKPGGK